MVGSGQVVQVATFDGLGLTSLVLCEGDDFDLVRDRLDVILVRVRRQIQRTLGRNKEPVQIRQHVWQVVVVCFLFRNWICTQNIVTLSLCEYIKEKHKATV